MNNDTMSTYEVTMSDGRQFLDIHAQSKEQAAAKAMRYANFRGEVLSIRKVSAY